MLLFSWADLRNRGHARPKRKGSQSGLPGICLKAVVLVGLHMAASPPVLLPSTLTFLADFLLVFFLQTPLKKTNALIAQMGITFLNAVSAYVNS